jgi:hypothetical protein
MPVKRRSPAELESGKEHGAGNLDEVAGGREGEGMKIGVLKTRWLVVLIAGLVCLAVGSGQEAKAPASESLDSLRGRAEKGSIGAVLELGVMHEIGLGVRRDYAEAVRWYRIAAERGHADGQLLLGLMYKGGQGVPRDYVEAYMWISLAASRAGVDDRERYADARDEVANKLTAQQLAEAQRRAREWKPASGENTSGAAVK